MHVHFVMQTTTILAILNVQNQILGIGIANSVILNASLALDLTISNASHVTIQIIGFMTEELYALKLVEMENCLVNISVMMETSIGMMDVVKTAIMNQDLHVYQVLHIRLLYVLKFVEMDDEST